MTPFASVAMLEKLALLKIALCRAPVVSSASVCRTLMLTSVVSGMLLWTVGICSSFHLIPTLYYDRCRRQWGCHPSPERTGSAAISGPGAGGCRVGGPEYCRRQSPADRAIQLWIAKIAAGASDGTEPASTRLLR